MQAVFIQRIPTDVAQNVRMLLPSAPGYISMEEVKSVVDAEATFFCKLKNDSLVELQDFLADVFPDIHFEIKEATKL